MRAIPGSTAYLGPRNTAYLCPRNTAYLALETRHTRYVVFLGQSMLCFLGAGMLCFYMPAVPRSPKQAKQYEKSPKTMLTHNQIHITTHFRPKYNFWKISKIIDFWPKFRAPGPGPAARAPYQEPPATPAPPPNGPHGRKNTKRDPKQC